MRARLWLIVGLQVLVLLAMAGYYQYIISFGTVVRLQAEPYDPLSLFQGRYVWLQYNISQWTPETQGSLLFENGRPYESLWVVLEEHQPYWRIALLSKTRPVQLLANQVAVSARLVPRFTSSHRIEYGIESFFAPEQLAPELERLGRTSKFEVDVAVGPDGRALIKRVYMNGQPVDLKPR